MTARALQVEHSDIIAEMARLHAAGFSLLPMGRGEDGKSPLLKFAGTQRLPLKRVLAPMHRTGSTCYGIRLDGFAVVDCDTDDPDLVSAMEARFGASPVHVRTPRGRHLWFRAGAGVYPNLRAQGLLVDIKRGANGLVMGPGSLRPDGGAYVPAKGILGADNLPTIRLLPSATVAPAEPHSQAGARVPEGERHQILVKAAVAMVADVDSLDELLDALAAIRDQDCETPDSLPDGELRGIAEWTWRCRLEGRVYHERMSSFRVQRDALDVLRGQPNQSDAIALFVLLQDQHGHRPGYAFALDHDGMHKAGLTDLSRRRFRAARDTLLDRGLLQLAHNHFAGRASRSYRLCRPLPADGRVSSLRGPRRGAGRAGEEV